MSPIKFQSLQQGGTTLLVVPELVEHITPSWFDLNWWRDQGLLESSAPGRGESYFVNYSLQQSNLERSSLKQSNREQPSPSKADPEQKVLPMVWRHYRRGGVVSRFSEDSYLWPGLTKTRPWLELNLTADLYDRGLPVPRPLAARVVREGLFYRADLLTERLPKVKSMADRLSDNNSDLPWSEIGATVAEFHQIGLDHVDLNIRNILLGQDNRVYLIDFDRCRLRSLSKGWQKSNLDRLRRSIDKEFSSACSDSDWQQLLQGYGGFLGH
ncbi:MAG: 3-deoxy-D-manno-octulosonic acid kinase [Motiliproteus sp.]